MLPEDTGFIGSQAVRAARVPSGTDERSSSRSRSTGPGSPAPGNRGRRRRNGHQRHASHRAFENGIGMAYLPAAVAEPGSAIEIDVRGKIRPAEVARQTALQKGGLTWPKRATPRICSTTPNTTGRGSTRMDATATMGITWYAQDALGEVVFFDAPAVGDDGHEGWVLRRGRVGQGRQRGHRADVRRDRSRSTVRSRMILPWSTRIPTARLAGQGEPVVRRERESLMDSAAYTAMLG